jgi:hypothetical protein
MLGGTGIHLMHLAANTPHNTSGFVLATKLADISSGIATAFN